MSIVILGSKSELAKSFTKLLKKKKIKHLTFNRKDNGKNYLNEILTAKKNYKQFNYREKNSIFIFFGISSQKDCEKNKSLAIKINEKITKQIIKKFKNSCIVFISSSAVFGKNKKTRYSEFSKPCPETLYGKLKLKVEKFIKKNVKNYLIVRSGWIISNNNKCIVYDTFKKILKNNFIVKKNSLTNIISDGDFSKGLYFLFSKNRNGIYHISNNKNILRENIAKIISTKVLKKNNYKISRYKTFKKNINFVLKSKLKNQKFTSPEKLVKLKLKQLIKS